MAAPNSQSPSVRTHFKTPEGRYKLSHEKTHPTSLLHYSHGKAITQVTLAHLKDKPLQTPSTSSSSSSSGGVGARFSAVRLLASGNGSRGLGFGGGNGFSGRLTGGGKSTTVSTAGVGLSNGPLASSYDGEGTFLIFNVGDALFVSDYASQDKDPIKCLHFSNANPISHTYDSDAKDGHDLLIGLSSGDVYTASLRQQLQDPGKKLIGAMHYNKDGAINSSRCTSVAWVPRGDGLFVVAHADGNVYVYDKNKEGSGDVPFPPVRDQAQFSVAHARSSKSNPIARWHICQGSINEIAFSPNGLYLATVGRDGYLRVFDYAKEQLTCGSKSYFGALLCCAWRVRGDVKIDNIRQREVGVTGLLVSANKREVFDVPEYSQVSSIDVHSIHSCGTLDCMEIGSPDGKYVLTGGEDDLVQVWSMEDQRVVAWGEGHNSWVSAVAFDPYWIAPPSDESGESVTYRFGSVGQDTQLLLWDLAMDEVVVPLRRLGGTLSGSPAFREGGAHSARWEGVQPVGILHPAPMRKEVPKLAPVMAHRVHAEPLSSLIFTKEAILTACHEGHVKIWDRPGTQGDSPARNSDTADASSKEKLPPAKSGLSQFKQ